MFGNMVREEVLINRMERRAEEIESRFLRITRNPASLNFKRITLVRH